jgi:hypothetical protein
LTSTQDIAVTVTPVNEFAPAFTSPANISVTENTLEAAVLTASDADLPAPSIEYVIAGGGDWQLFNLDPSSGVLSFVVPPSYNAPNDAGLDHIYNIRVEANDGEFTASLDLVINVVNPNQPSGSVLLFKSAGAHDGWILEAGENANQGGSFDKSSAALFAGDDAKDRQYRSILSFDTSSIPDDAILTSAQVKIKKQGVVGNDPFITHGDLLLEIRGGSFSNTVALNMEDFSAAASSNSTQDKFASDGGNWYAASLSAANLSIVNKYGFTQFRLKFSADDNDDLDADYVRFFSGDAETSQPELTIIYTTPNSSTGGAIKSFALAAEPTPVLEPLNHEPVLQPAAGFSTEENAAGAGTVAAADVDLPAQPLSYSILGGADAALFALDPLIGALSFLSPPDFDAPKDAGADNVYNLIVQVSDGSLTAAQSISIQAAFFVPLIGFAP